MTDNTSELYGMDFKKTKDSSPEHTLLPDVDSHDNDIYQMDFQPTKQVSLAPAVGAAAVSKEVSSSSIRPSRNRVELPVRERKLGEGVVKIADKQPAFQERESRNAFERRLRKTMIAINESPEVLRAKDLATHKANTGRRGKNRKNHGSRMQGRNHGPKSTITTLINELNEWQQK